MLKMVPDESLQAPPDAVVRRDLPDDRAREADECQPNSPLLGDVDRVVVERVRRVGDGHERVHEAVAGLSECGDANK